ncbi:3205_t:CDS:2, partial [Racocetra fulgida]
MRSILYVFIISFLVAVVSSFPNGSGTCNSIQATIEGVPNSPMGKLNSALTYAFDLDLKKSNYVPGRSAVLTIKGPQPYKGLLLYAVDSAKNHVGSWSTPKGYKILSLNCTGDPKGTITHDSPDQKNPTDTKLTWTAPAKDVGPITFIGTIVVDQQTGFQVVKSPIFSVAGSKFTAPATPTGTATNPQPQASASAPDGNPDNSGSTSSTNSTSSTTSDASSLMDGSLLLAKLGFVATL